MMILTQKVTQLAFSVHDGKAANQEKQNDFQKHYKTDRVPSLLEYFGHVFVFTGFLAGPNHQFRDYKAFIDGSVKAPSCFFVSLAKLLVSFFFIGVKFIPGVFKVLLPGPCLFTLLLCSRYFFNQALSSTTTPT